LGFVKAGKSTLTNPKTVSAAVYRGKSGRNG
jgi:hypothetical protein